MGLELGNLLDDLQVPTKYTTVLLDPYVVRKGTEFTEKDIDVITEAGRELKLRLDKIQNSGSIHLKAVYEKSKVCSYEVVSLINKDDSLTCIPTILSIGTFEFISFFLR